MLIKQSIKFFPQHPVIFAFFTSKNKKVIKIFVLSKSTPAKKIYFYIFKFNSSIRHFQDTFSENNHTLRIFFNLINIDFNNLQYSFIIPVGAFN